jgi:hypothetical protein
LSLIFTAMTNILILLMVIATISAWDHQYNARDSLGPMNTTVGIDEDFGMQELVQFKQKLEAQREKLNEEMNSKNYSANIAKALIALYVGLNVCILLNSVCRSEKKAKNQMKETM